MSPEKTLLPDGSVILMLWGALSWLSKATEKAEPAFTLTAVWTNLMSLAVMATVFPDALPAGTGAWLWSTAEAPEQAASTAARATMPRVRVRRFMSMTPADR